MAAIIDGKALAAELRAAVALEAAGLRAHGIVPRLDLVRVGDDPASHAYTATKSRMAEAAGIDGRLHVLPHDLPESELLALIDCLNEDAAVHGILVQLPLPPQIRTSAVLEAVRPDKDVDGFHPLNLGRLAAGRRDDHLVPCTPQGCMRLLEKVLGSKGLTGKRAVVLGRSTIVGRPLALLLLGADCTVTVAHSRTRDLPALCRAAEILVAAVGRPELVRGDWVGEGAVVLDVGINRVEHAGTSRLVGDVAFAEAAPRAAAITPVPGGVGPMTVACLLHNTVLAARRASEAQGRPAA